MIPFYCRLAHFNNLDNNNEQDVYLMGLISSSPAARHIVSNPRRFRMRSFKYKVRTGLEDINVCMRSFCRFHGISVGRVSYKALYQQTYWHLIINEANTQKID